MFKLSIECTKDIDAINITFSDGKIAAVTPGQGSGDSQIISGADEAVQTVSGVVAKPHVPDTDDRRVNIAGNLQNLDI